MSTVKVPHGVWLPAAAAADPVARLSALHQVLPPAAVYSDVTAAELHGLWLPTGTRRPVEVTIPAAAARPAYTTGPQRVDLRAHRRCLGPDEIGFVAGLRVTTAARTWCDLAEVFALPDLVAAGDCALRGGLTTVDLARALARRHGRRGRRRAREALPLLDARSRSRPESHLRVAIADAGLPAPAVNVAVHDEHGQWLAEPDLSYREARLAIEYQGAGHADPARMRGDIARQLELHRAGWLVLAYAAPALSAPDQVARDVRDVLSRRAPALLRRGRPSVSDGGVP